MDDEALLQRARSGDREAFGDLVTRYQDELYTMALRMTGSPADAADIVQETFTRAYIRVADLRGVTVRSWLFRVAVNAAHDIFRLQKRRPTSALEDREGNIVELPDPTLGPEHGALRREEAEAIRAALLRLPDDYRQVVVMRDVNDLSYDEIATALSIPVGTVKSRINRGRLLMSNALRATSLFAVPAQGEA